MWGSYQVTGYVSSIEFRICIIRLQHTATKKLLHSHPFPSPLSKQLQEVSAFAQQDGEGDEGDNWRVECDSHWKR